MKKEHTGGLTPIGDLMKADLRFKPPTKTQWGLIEAAAEIGMGKKGLPTYQHTVLCQTSLPYRRTAERVRERLNVDTMLRVEAGTAYTANVRTPGLGAEEQLSLVLPLLDPLSRLPDFLRERPPDRSP